MSSAVGRTGLVGWHTKVKGRTGPDPVIICEADSDGNVQVRVGMNEPWPVHVSELDILDQVPAQPKPAVAPAPVSA